MAELKTRENDADVRVFLEGITDENKRNDAYAILALMRELTGDEPKMWGTNIVGFGKWHFKYQSGREGDWFKTGFSPRKDNMTLYIMGYVFDKQPELLEGLGKYKTGKGCLYIKRLSDVNQAVLRNLIEASFKLIS